MRASSQPNRRLRVLRTAEAVIGGGKVLENPDRRGDEAVLFWRSELLVDLVRLIAAPADTDSPLRFDPRRWTGQLATLATDEGLNLILRLPGDTDHRLLFPGPDPPRDGSPLAIGIEPNRFWRFRVAAAQRFLAPSAPRRFLRLSLRPTRPPLNAPLSTVNPTPEPSRPVAGDGARLCPLPWPLYRRAAREHPRLAGGWGYPGQHWKSIASTDQGRST